MENWKEFKKVKEEGLTKRYKNNYYMADTTQKVIIIFKNLYGNDVVIYKQPLIESCYLESQQVWKNLCKANKVYNSRDEFLDDDGFTEKEKEKITQDIIDILERGEE